MNPSIISKLEQLSARHQEVSALLAELAIINDQERFRALSKEYAQLQPVAGNFAAYQQLLQEQAAAREMAKESDPEPRALAEEELLALDGRFEALEQELQSLLLPSDPHDRGAIFIAGGAIFLQSMAH